MKKQLVLALFALSASLFGQQTTLQLQDMVDGPLSTSGAISLSETITGTKAEMSYTDDLRITNVAHKPILMFLQLVEVTFSNGNRQNNRKEYDSFFASKLLTPSALFDYGPQNHGTVVIDISRGTTPVEPNCTLRTLFVQFDDGTTFGNDKFAAHILDIRQSIWSALAGLYAVYQKSGDAAFVSALNDRAAYSPSVNGFLEMTRMIQKTKGTQAAVSEVHQKLNLAEERQNKLALAAKN